MNGFAWAMLILAGMVGALLVVTIGAIVLALLLAGVSERLARHDDDRRD
jgi:hypothetical protein